MFVPWWEPFSWMGSVPLLLKLLAGKDLLGHLEVSPGIFPPAYSPARCPATLTPKEWMSGCVQDTRAADLTFWAKSVPRCSHLCCVWPEVALDQALERGSWRWYVQKSRMEEVVGRRTRMQCTVPAGPRAGSSCSLGLCPTWVPPALFASP